jgi:hypothetical protein
VVLHPSASKIIFVLKDKQMQNNVPYQLLTQANKFDKTVYYSKKWAKQILQKYLPPLPYSQKLLYDNMLNNKTAVYTNYPMKMSKQYGDNNLDALIQNLETGLPQKEKINIRTGPSRTLKRVTIKEVIEKWKRQKAKFGVTDLHFRGTAFYKKVDAQAVSYFNLLPHCPYDVSFLEMMTLVISAKGIFSDSHSDDGDGSNHCFTGKKLWLAWDRVEGQQKGLQDCTHDNVYSKAKFNMQKFLSLKSSHWFVVSDNNTLFMPGNFTHKVITLEPYIGFGSFYVSIPGYINTLKRWLLYPTSDVKGNFLNILCRYGSKQINKISSLQKNVQQQWGYNYLKKATSQWQQGLTALQIKQLQQNELFTSALSFAKQCS